MTQRLNVLIVNEHMVLQYLGIIETAGVESTEAGPRGHFTGRIIGGPVAAFAPKVPPQDLTTALQWALDMLDTYDAGLDKFLAPAASLEAKQIDEHHRAHKAWARQVLGQTR